MNAYANRRIETKICQHCKTPFQARSGKQRFCRPRCQADAWIKKQDSKNLRTRHYKCLLKKRGLTLEDYEMELQNQDYVCAICFESETAKQNGTVRRLAVDHDHLTGCYRGLLCMRCNTAIGKFKENIAVMKQAIQYLEKNRDPRDNT